MWRIDDLRGKLGSTIALTILSLVEDDDRLLLRRLGFPDGVDPAEAVAGIRAVLSGYGQRLVEIPFPRLKELPYRIVEPADPMVVEVEVRLWTATEAPSDLVLSMRFVEDLEYPVPDMFTYNSEVVSLEVAPFEGVRGVPPPPLERPPLERVVRDPDPELDPVPERWRAMLGELVHRLVVGDFDGLVDDGLVTEGFVPYLRESVTSYSAHLVDLPEEAWAYSHHIAGDDPVAEVTVWLWSEEEGISDLSMDATVWDDGINPPTAQVFMVEVK